ncbi:RICIN domain-containing protein [Pseudoduganella namucuonensis]|uniref:Ricin-type beta-trefoil lectin domain-containing protein n=1 Tax=Pseudoduganella namucuonensis TaxID=1035707 RepID=A0A1I7M4Y7_9BURK|nr:RICIN domain-containing protein [Pseudoduganella namucuonensis]SFV16998.1 Ricin-type beta-trefoil lectin domain-containing protein [Pseudoduganella namucuonensis]
MRNIAIPSNAMHPFQWIITIMLLCALAGCGGEGGNGGSVGARTVLHGTVVTDASVVAIENARQGTESWKLVNPALQHEIEGYASATSVNTGGSITLYVSTSASSYNIDIYRMGYYGGAGARKVGTYSGLTGVTQPQPCSNPNGVVECNWNASQSITAAGPDGGWISGIYLAKLTTNALTPKDSYIIFVVRDDARAATFVAQLPITTYQAYNYWGGKSLYTGCVNHDSQWKCANGAKKATAVSFNRPFIPSSNPSAAFGAGAGEFITNVQTVAEGYPISSAAFDYNMIRWIEKQGYDTKYITNMDLHVSSAPLSDSKAFISFGHDEYYSKTMWDNLIGLREAGKNIAFFSSNQIYWRVRFVEGHYGASRENRTMICFKDVPDPTTDPALTTGLFRNLGTPEAGLIGNQYTADPVLGAITITNAAHWLIAGTGAENGTSLPGLLGYEINTIVPGVSPANVVSLAHSVVGNDSSDVSFYIAPSSSQVFATGSMQWAWGLDGFTSNGLRSDYTSAIAQAITANVFDALAEVNIATLINAASGQFLSTPAGSLTAAEVIQNVSPASGSKSNQWRLLPDSDGTNVRIVSRAIGLCLDAYGSAEGGAVGTWECHGEENQKWLLIDRGGSYYSIMDKRSKLCLQNPGGAGTAGARLTLTACSSASHQLWFLSTPSTGGPSPPLPTPDPPRSNVVIALNNAKTGYFMSASGMASDAIVQAPLTAENKAMLQWRPLMDSGGYFALVSIASGQCLDAYGAADGATAGTWPCHGELNQQWSFSQNSDGTYTVISRSNLLCLGSPDSSNTPQSPLKLLTCTYGNAQRWHKSTPEVAPMPGEVVTFSNGANGYHLSTPANVMQAAPVIQAPAPGNGAIMNRWRLTASGDGPYFQVVSEMTGLCLDAYGSSDQSQAGTWLCHGGDNQKWSIAAGSGGYFSISDKRSNRCIESPGASTTAGAVLVMSACSGAAHTVWMKSAVP